MRAITKAVIELDKHGRIYIADDDDNIRKAIKAFLENDGCTEILRRICSLLD